MEINKPNLTQKNKNNSAKKSYDGISSIINTVVSNLGDPKSRGNASTIYNIMKYFW